MYIVVVQVMVIVFDFCLDSLLTTDTVSRLTMEYVVKTEVGCKSALHKNSKEVLIRVI